MARMIACEGCRFYDWTGTCANKRCDVPDPIEGSVHNYARLARQPDGPCGPYARFYRRRPAQSTHRLQGRVGAFLCHSARILSTGILALAISVGALAFTSGLLGFSIRDVLPLAIPLCLTLAFYTAKLLWRMTEPSMKPAQPVAATQPKAKPAHRLATSTYGAFAIK